MNFTFDYIINLGVHRFAGRAFRLKHISASLRHSPSIPNAGELRSHNCATKGAVFHG